MFFNPIHYYFVIIFVDLKTRVLPVVFQTGNGGGAGSHKWIKNCSIFWATGLYHPFYYFQRFLSGVIFSLWVLGMNS